MKEQFNVGFVDVGGWDTHVGEGRASGFPRHPARGARARARRLRRRAGSAWQDTVVVLISEFGRTFRENGNRGTDHGPRHRVLVLGGSVRGGRIVGDQVSCVRRRCFQNRDYRAQ